MIESRATSVHPARKDYRGSRRAEYSIRRARFPPGVLRWACAAVWRGHRSCRTGWDAATQADSVCHWPLAENDRGKQTPREPCTQAVFVSGIPAVQTVRERRLLANQISNQALVTRRILSRHHHRFTHPGCWTSKVSISPTRFETREFSPGSRCAPNIQSPRWQNSARDLRSGRGARREHQRDWEGIALK